MAATGSRPGERGVEPIPSRDFAVACAAPLVAALARGLAPVSLDPLSRLVWLLGLFPIFLLARHRGWQGVGMGFLLSAGAIILTEPLVAVLHDESVEWPVIGTLVLFLGGVALAVGFDSRWWRGHVDVARGSARAPMQPSVTPKGVLDRLAMEFLLGRAFAGARREPPLAIVLVEVDRLDEYAGLYGMDKAEAALDLLVDVLSQHTRGMNLIGRSERHSFLVILQGEDLVGAHAFATRILQEIETHPAPWQGRVHLNAGVAAFEPDLNDSGQLLGHAARALETARTLGGSACVVFVGAEAQEPQVAGMMVLRPGGKLKKIHRTL